ncbi:magnesium-dependent phosphatase 1 isoform X1 [Carex littledalei]|uniref:Magnesium-dependent phosphatase 1 isoform X1 n=1 Tax=Carex littledalei TaxID=544730 RepID=A0A833VTC0_9POAL|nr:magnesium-dependent phosphatase 1 isoform X1 [Carex littledalei]
MEGEEKVRAEATEVISLFPVLPRLVVFDLDYTIWPYDCDHYSKGQLPYPPYPHATGITQALKDKGVDLAVASRSPTPDIAKSYLEIMGIQSLFIAQEIFLSWSPKTEHFKGIQRTTGIAFNEMLFFDDDYRNIHTAKKMGVTSVLVKDGVTLEKLRLGLSIYANKFASSNRNQAQQHG